METRLPPCLIRILPQNPNPAPRTPLDPPPHLTPPVQGRPSPALAWTCGPACTGLALRCHAPVLLVVPEARGGGAGQQEGGAPPRAQLRGLHRHRGRLPRPVGLGGSGRRCPAARAEVCSSLSKALLAHLSSPPSLIFNRSVCPKRSNLQYRCSRSCVCSSLTLPNTPLFVPLCVFTVQCEELQLQLAFLPAFQQQLRLLGPGQAERALGPLWPLQLGQHLLHELCSAGKLPRTSRTG